MPRSTNQLIHETSPYLQQHAHNPVNWYPWGEEALLKAKQEDKPILVSIGYAACHWCHVMERESFEDEATAAVMNEHFINIKIDREERPDLDHIYMDAVQAMTGSGGWPLNVFLTPDRKPFYGGTYFPPRRAFNRASWQEVLQGVRQAFAGRREEIEAQAGQMVDHLVKSNGFGFAVIAADEQLFKPGQAAAVTSHILATADKEWGGFGKAPKFPQTFTIRYLLRFFHNEKQGPHAELAEAARQQALLSLDKMIEGGIYDQVGGGFARYATDTEWLVPHFEKMLYDNALLVNVLSEALQLTRDKRYERVIHETMAFVSRELQDEEGGFYAAIDADSEGEEGKFYVWEMEEVKQVLGEDAGLFCEYYDVSAAGNWEGKNILRVKQDLPLFASQRGLDPSELEELLAHGRQQLLDARAGRIRPLLDDKIILGWNALMNTACSKAYAATGEEAYLRLALRNMQALLTRFASSTPGLFHHTWKNGKASYPAFLDDYAFLVEALLHLQWATGDNEWLGKALLVTEQVLARFGEEETGYFYFTPEDQGDVIMRKKEVYDGAVPSGNSAMAYNLYRLGILYDRPQWKERSSRMLVSLQQAVVKYPTSFGNWATLLLEWLTGTQEIAVIGPEKDVYNNIIYEYLPQAVIQYTAVENQEFALLTGKKGGEKTKIYLCKNFACQEPVHSAKELISLIHRGPQG